MLAPAQAVKYNRQAMVSIEMIYGVALTAVPILASLSVHEFAHARTALAFGDPTARNMGRCTLNPLAHLDVVGTLLMVLVGFGWAKPVPVGVANLHPRRLGQIAVSIAGPLSNIVLALLCVAALRILAAAGVGVDPQAALTGTDVAVFLLMYALIINLNLAMFNLIPLFPLDGHHVGREILPPRLAPLYMRWQRQYGRWAFIALWIGPSMLERFGRFHFDPIGWYLGSVVWPSMQFLLGEATMRTALTVLPKFKPFLFWMN